MSVISLKFKNNRYQSSSDYLYVFENFNSLSDAILFLHRQNPNLYSALYKTDNEYRLIIRSKTFKPYLLTLYEYSLRQSRNVFEIAFTKEHSKALIEKNAVSIFYKYFLK